MHVGCNELGFALLIMLAFLHCPQLPLVLISLDMHSDHVALWRPYISERRGLDRIPQGVPACMLGSWLLYFILCSSMHA